MKFTCLKENLYQGLQVVTPLARKTANLPVLNNILIKGEMGGVRLISTNLEIAINCLVRAKTEKEGGFTFPAKLLFDFISSLPNGKIECTLRNQSLEIVSGSFQGKIKGVPSEEFPLIPQVSKNSVHLFGRKKIEKTLQGVLFSASRNDPRPELNGVFFASQKDGKTTFAATDSYRLAEATIIPEEAPAQAVAGVIIPARTLEEVLRIIHDFDPEQISSISLSIEENQIVFSLGPVELISRLIDGKYPEYQQIIPSGFKTTAVLSKSELLKTIKSVSLFSSGSLHEINMRLDPEKRKITLHSSGGQFGEGKGEVEAELTGETNEAVFNYHYLLDGLNVFDAEKITLKLIDGNSPAVMEISGEKDYLYLIMPIKQ